MSSFRTLGIRSAPVRGAGLALEGAAAPATAAASTLPLPSQEKHLGITRYPSLSLQSNNVLFLKQLGNFF